MKPDYAKIDVHSSAAPGWPADIPTLTEPEAIRAFRRLYRFSMGNTFDGIVQLTSGNRRALRMDWFGNSRLAAINPSKGWREFAHDASHWFDLLMNGETKHGKHHARFEAKLIREIVRRGYLEGVLRTDADREVTHEEAIDPAEAKAEERAKRMWRIDELLAAWARKESRALNAIAKLDRERRRIERAIAKAAL